MPFQATAVDRGIMLLGCPSVCPILMSTVSEERLEGILQTLEKTLESLHANIVITSILTKKALNSFN